jgi:hypothetical protein
MNPTIHSKISVKRFGGKIEDYHKIHSFMDSSKEVEPTNLHRCLTHHLWFVKNVVIPVFGGHFKNSDNRDVDVKDLCELDHILPDFQNKFVPSLSDYFELFEPNNEDVIKITKFNNGYYEWLNDCFGEDFTDEVISFMMQPFHNTGTYVSLYLTHNSWFVNTILPKVFKRIGVYHWDCHYNGVDVIIKPSDFLNRMKYDSWIQNGQTYPKSHEKVKKYREESFKKDIKSAIESVERAKEDANQLGYQLLDSTYHGLNQPYLDNSSSKTEEEMNKHLKNFPRDTIGDFNLDDPKPKKELDYKFLDAYYDGSRLGPRTTNTRKD